MRRTLADYEQTQLQALRRWQAEPPPPAARLMSRAAGPASRAVQKAIPTQALSAALAGVQKSAMRLNGHKSILKKAGVANIEALRDAPLQTCDELSKAVRHRAMAMGGGAGALFGVAGTAGLVADVPTLLVLAFRTIHRVGLCYGEVLAGEGGRPLLTAIFALASANTVEEKQLALSALQRPELIDQSGMAWREGMERAAERELAKDAAMFSLNNLAQQLGRHLGWRKAAGAMPVVGALIGGSVNAWYLYDLANVTRYCFQERWLRAHFSERVLARSAAVAALVQN